MSDQNTPTATWSREWPTVDGWYWFHGWTGLRRDTPATTSLVRARTLNGGAVMYVSEGTFVYAHDGTDGLWLPAELPSKPVLDRGACAVVRQGDRVLVSRRHDSVPFFPGMLQFPGGKVDDNERGSEGAARELREETGIEVCPATLAAIGTWPGAKGGAPYSVTVYDAIGYVDLTKLTNPEPEKCGPWYFTDAKALLASQDPCIPGLREAIAALVRWGHFR